MSTNSSNFTFLHHWCLYDHVCLRLLLSLKKLITPYNTFHDIERSFKRYSRPYRSRQMVSAEKVKIRCQKEITSKVTRNIWKDSVGKISRPLILQGHISISITKVAWHNRGFSRKGWVVTALMIFVAAVGTKKRQEESIEPHLFYYPALIVFQTKVFLEILFLPSRWISFG